MTDSDDETKSDKEIEKAGNKIIPGLVSDGHILLFSFDEIDTRLFFGDCEMSIDMKTKNWLVDQLRCEVLLN